MPYFWRICLSNSSRDTRAAGLHIVIAALYRDNVVVNDLGLHPKIRGHRIVKRGCWSLPMCMRELLELFKFDLKLGIDWNARHDNKPFLNIVSRLIAYVQVGW